MTQPYRRNDAPTRPAAIASRSAETTNGIQAVVIGLDQAFRDSEAKWGVGRLECLVGDQTRLSFQRGMAIYQTALWEGDLPGVQAVAPKMRAALGFMDAEATAAGHKPLSPVVWEALQEDGTVLAIVRTGHEASAVARDGRQMVVWSMEEVARVLAKLTVTNVVKLEFPGAKVQRVTQHDEGFAADWAAQTGLDDEAGLA